MAFPTTIDFVLLIFSLLGACNAFVKTISATLVPIGTQAEHVIELGLDHAAMERPSAFPNWNRQLRTFRRGELARRWPAPAPRIFMGAAARLRRRKGRFCWSAPGYAACCDRSATVARHAIRRGARRARGRGQVERGRLARFPLLVLLLARCAAWCSPYFMASSFSPSGSRKNTA